MIRITATFVRILREGGILVPKEAGVILIINLIYWYIFYYSLLRASVGQYTEYGKNIFVKKLIFYVRSGNIVEDLLLFSSCSLITIPSPNCNLESSSLMKSPCHPCLHTPIQFLVLTTENSWTQHPRYTTED